MANEHIDKLELPLSSKQIAEIIPHRYPFLLVDCITEITEDSAKGYKNITFNEPQFQGHFPGEPIMPGVLMVEALAQLGCAQLLIKQGRPKNKLAVFAGIDKVKFRQLVVPGDKLDLEVKVIWERGNDKKLLGKTEAIASVNGKVAVQGECMFALVDTATL